MLLVYCRKLHLNNNLTVFFLLNFSDPVTPIMEGIVDLHNHIMFYLIVILFFVLYIFFSILWDFYVSFVFLRSLADLDFRYVLLQSKHITHGTRLELIWTVTPSLILMLIAIPSFALLYSMDEVINPSLTLKAVGHQWYWNYQYSDYVSKYGKVEFDSYMVPTTELVEGQFRLLEVDNQVVLPSMTHIRFSFSYCS